MNCHPLTFACFADAFWELLAGGWGQRRPSAFHDGRMIQPFFCIGITRASMIVQSRASRRNPFTSTGWSVIGIGCAASHSEEKRLSRRIYNGK